MALASVLIFDVSAARTPSQVTKVLAVTLLPFSLVGPFTGPFIDRFSRRSILVGASLARAALTSLLFAGIGWPEGVLLALAVTNISINRFFHSTKGAVLPTLVPRDLFLTANAVSTTVGMVFGLAGGVAGGPIADAVSPGAAIAAAAVLMLAAAGVAATLPLPRGERRGLAGIASELRENLRDVRDGLRVLRGSGPASYGVAAVWTMRALLGFVLIAALVLLRSRFDARATGFSAVLGAVAVGGFVGALAVQPAARRLGHAGVGPAAFVLAGTAALALAPIPAWPAVLAAVFFAGAAMSGTKIASDTLVQGGVPDRYRGRAFAVYDIGYNGMFVVAALVPALVRPLAGDLGIVVMTALAALAAAAALARWRRRLPPTVEVRAYAGGRADETPREIVWDGVPIAVTEVEGSWHEQRREERLLRFRLRLADGRRVEVISTGEGWRLDRVLPPRG